MLFVGDGLARHVLGKKSGQNTPEEVCTEKHRDNNMLGGGTAPREQIPVKSLIIGVAGGTGSGKSTLVDQIIERVGPDLISCIKHDSYYRDLSHMPMDKRRKVNFDHPDSLETELLVTHLHQLREKKPIRVPVFDFVTLERREETTQVNPHNIIILEGILVLAISELREMMDIKLYVDVCDDLRLARRIQRDVQVRGRTIESVIEQYFITVQPMHRELVEPSKQYADFIIPMEKPNQVAIEVIVNHIRMHTGQYHIYKGS